jgi:hypothetical protein
MIFHNSSALAKPMNASYASPSNARHIRAHPMQLLRTLRLRRRRRRRNTRYQAGATPYLGRTCAGWDTASFAWRAGCPGQVRATGYLRLFRDLLSPPIAANRRSTGQARVTSGTARQGGRRGRGLKAHRP